MQRRTLGPWKAILWTGLGMTTGLVLGVLLSEWAGSVNRPRLRRVARRLRDSAPAKLSAREAVLAAETALARATSLTSHRLEVRALAPGAVELRGWVPARADRALAARLVREVPGIERVTNGILVHGEDDRPSSTSERSADQSA